MTDTLVDKPASVQSSPAEGYGTAIDRELVARATALVPLIREYAAKADGDDPVVPEVVQALADAGLYKIFVPKRYGGHGANMATGCEVLAEISRGDGSTGWSSSLLNVCTWFATTFSEKAQDEVFGANPDARVCGIFTPGSKSERVEGGYLVSGRWPWSSGSFAADWATLGIGIDVPEGEDPRALALIPKEAWTIERTWFMSGMRGTGSDTIVVNDHFVPEHRVQQFVGMREADFLTPYKEDQNSFMAFIPVAALILVAPQVGLARHALERTRQSLPSKGVAYTIYTEAGKSPAHQLGVANAATKFHLAELLLRQGCYDIDDNAALHRLPTMEVRARVRNDTGVVAELVTQGLDMLMTANGAGSFAQANVLSRIWRDSNTAARHAYVSAELGKEVYGKILLGDDALTMDL